MVRAKCVETAVFPRVQARARTADSSVRRNAGSLLEPDDSP